MYKFILLMFAVVGAEVSEIKYIGGVPFMIGGVQSSIGAPHQAAFSGFPGFQQFAYGQGIARPPRAGFVDGMHGAVMSGFGGGYPGMYTVPGFVGRMQGIQHAGYLRDTPRFEQAGWDIGKQHETELADALSSLRNQIIEENIRS